MAGKTATVSVMSLGDVPLLPPPCSVLKNPGKTAALLVLPLVAALRKSISRAFDWSAVIAIDTASFITYQTPVA